MPQPIRVVIVDDHLMVRKGLRLMLEEAGEEIEFIGDAADGIAAISLIEQLQPDVVVMDIRMPRMDGIAALKHIHATWSHIAVLLLTTYDEDELMLQGLQAGACGYMLKDTPLETLLNAIRTAARGDMLIQPEIMGRLLAHTASESRAISSPSSTDLIGPVELSKREREVLLGVAQGERSKEIALRLGITERTVRAYLTNIYTKLNVDSRSSAVAVAVARGLLS